MAEIPVSNTSVIPMQLIAVGVVGLRIAFVNLYGVERPEGDWILIDAGLPFSAHLIRNWAEEQFRKSPAAIVLTHGHFDHASAAGELAGEWDIPIYAHPLEFPYLTGQQEYPRPDFRAGGGLMSLLSPLYPKGPLDLGKRLLAISDANAEEVLPGWKVIHTPGHTPGHISFFRPSDRVLIVGDAFCTTKPESFFDAAVAQPPELHGPPAYFTQDWSAATRSIQALVNLEARVIAPGHGKPLAGESAGDAVRKLAQQITAEQAA